MAINTQKLLPGSTGTQKALPQAKISSITLTSPDKKNVNTIRVKTIQIDKILKGTLAADKKKLTDKKKEASKQRKEDIETNLEKKPDLKKKIKMPKILPKMGILDWIKNFIGNILLGWVAMRLLDNTSLLSKVVVGIVATGEFIIDWGGRILDAIVSLVDWGYKLYDGFRDQVENIFGQDGIRKFDEFSDNLKTVMQAVIALATVMAIAGPRIFPRFGRGGPTRPGGGGPPRPGGPPRAPLGPTQPIRPSALRQFGASLQTGTAFRRAPGLQRGLYRGGLRLAQAAKMIKPAVGGIPIIGGLLEFAISWAIGEPLGKAAFRGIGSTLGMWLGIAIGSIPVLIPFGGPLIGSILGGWGGAELGGVMYDAWFGGKKPSPTTQEIPGRQGGGVIGKKKKRRRKVKKAKRVFTPRPLPTLEARRASIIPVGIDPGRDISGTITEEDTSDRTNIGKSQIFRLFPNPWGGRPNEPEDASPLEFIKKYGNKFAKIRYLGPILTLAIKSLVGQEPKDVDYNNASLGLSALYEQTKSSGFAGGGIVGGRKDSKDELKKLLKASIDPVVGETITEIQKNLGLLPEGSTPSTTTTSTNSGRNGRSPTSTGPSKRIGSADDLIGGARMFMALGFPLEAAAILSGNVFQESGWKGQRAPWIVAGERRINKGLMSWNNGSVDDPNYRLDRAEKWLNVSSLEKASNVQQVKWIKEELRQYGLLDEFMDPNRSWEDRKKDSYKYIKWGSVGVNRWNYALQALDGVKRGEWGTYKGGSSLSDVQGSHFAGLLGDFMKDLKAKGKGVVPGSIWRHPKHLPWEPESGHTPGSLHYRSQGARAIDLGGNGVKEQAPILAAIKEFDRKHNIAPIQLFHAGDDPTGGHKDHVHVAYHKGGKVAGERWAKVLTGEYVIDRDSTKALENNFPGFLDAINKADSSGAIQVLRNYASYEHGASAAVNVEQQMVPVPIPMGSSGGGGTVIIGGGRGEDPFSSLVSIG